MAEVGTVSIWIEFLRYSTLTFLLGSSREWESTGGCDTGPERDFTTAMSPCRVNTKLNLIF